MSNWTKVSKFANLEFGGTVRGGRGGVRESGGNEMRRGEFKDKVGMAYFKLETCNKEL